MENEVVQPVQRVASHLPLTDYLAVDRGKETWLIHKVLPVSGSMILYGDPKTGKSFAAAQLASALGTGTGWFSLKASRPSRVVYIQLDTSPALWAERLGEMQAGGIELGRNVFFSDPQTLGLWPLNILHSDHRAILKDSLAALEPDVVIVDTIRKVHNEDEDKATVMASVVSQLTSVVKPAALVMVMHSRKDKAEQAASLINDIRGSNFISGDVDTICRLTTRTLWLEGRAFEEHTISLERLSNGAWKLSDQAEFKELAQQFAADLAYPSNLARAQALAQASGKTVEACRKALERLSER